jgi:RNA polymerase sigma-70 factor (ECF subfamily)
MSDGLNALVLDRPLSTPPALESLAPEFAGVYETHHRQIFYLCLRLLGDPEKAEDATHDVFLKVWRKLDQFRGDSSLRTWIYQIALNHCRNLRQAWSERHIQTVEQDTLMDSPGAGEDSPLRVLEFKELGERIQTTLDRLTPEYRLLLLLVADEELSYEEIGALTDQTSDAVRGKLHRARKAFTAQFARTA